MNCKSYFTTPPFMSFKIQVHFYHESLIIYSLIYDLCWECVDSKL